MEYFNSRLLTHIRNIYSTDRMSAMLGLGHWLEQYNLTMLGFQVLSIGVQAKIIIIKCFSLTLFPLSHTHICLPLNDLHLLQVYIREFSR